MFDGLGTRPDFLNNLLLSLLIADALIGRTIRLLVFPLGVEKVGVLEAGRGCDNVPSRGVLWFTLDEMGLTGLAI